MKRKIGRPRKPESMKTLTLSIRLTKAELRLLTQKSRRHHAGKVSSYIKEAAINSYLGG